MTRNTWTVFAGLALLDIILWGRILPITGQGPEKISFLDVGQGDSTLISLSNGIRILTDAGPDGRARRELAEVLGGNGYLDLVILTHPELDHYGGLADILSSHRVGALIWNGRMPTKESDAWRRMEKELSKHGVARVSLKAGDRIRAGDAELSFLAPTTALLQSAEANDSSLVYILRSPAGKAIFTGDSGFPTERTIMAGGDISAEILKVGHHGSKFSSSPEFLAEIDPRIAVIEVGQGNRYGHPAPAVLERLLSSTRASVLRTDISGTIEIERLPGRLRIFTEK